MQSVGVFCDIIAVLTETTKADMNQPKRIFAYFYPQTLVDDYAVDIDGRRKAVDVTSNVLALSLDELYELKDDENTTDVLVLHCHLGPSRVEVVDSILSFFDVDTLEDVTADMLVEAHERLCKLTAIELSGSGWWVRIEGGRVSSNLKSGEAEHDAAVDGIESLVLAQHMAGLPVTSRSYVDALQIAIEACANNL